EYPDIRGRVDGRVGERNRKRRAGTYRVAHREAGLHRADVDVVDFGDGVAAAAGLCGNEAYGIVAGRGVDMARIYRSRRIAVAEEPAIAKRAAAGGSIGKGGYAILTAHYRAAECSDRAIDGNDVWLPGRVRAAAGFRYDEPYGIAACQRIGMIHGGGRRGERGAVPEIPAARGQRAP